MSETTGGIPSEEKIVLSAPATPFERRRLYWDQSDITYRDDKDTYVAAKDLEDSSMMVKVFDGLAARERGQENTWQKSREILDWYLRRDTYRECGMIGSLKFHNQMVFAHARKIILEAPAVEKMRVLENFIGLSLRETANALVTS